MQEQEVKNLFRYWSDDTGVVRLERWPEGFVLWFGGQIVFKLWKKKEMITASLKLDTTEAVISKIVQKEIAEHGRRKL